MVLRCSEPTLLIRLRSACCRAVPAQLLTVLPPYLPRSLDPGCAALLPRMRSLQRLVLDGNGVDDAAMQHIAHVPQLRWGPAPG